MEFCWPDAMNRPRVLDLGQDAFVGILFLHPLTANGVGPMLGEYQNVKIRVFAKIPQRELTVGLQLSLKVFATIC